MNFTIVGFGYHPMHLYFAAPGSIVPAESGKFATGYLTSEGLESLANVSSGSSNMLLIDILGSPDYDLQSTDLLRSIDSIIHPCEKQSRWLSLASCSFDFTG